MSSVIYEPKGRAREYAPLACNLFEGLCPYACTYCFAHLLPQNRRKDADPTFRPKEDVLERLERDAQRMAGDARPILFCFTSDPYPRDRRLCWVTRKAFAILTKHDLHWTILTKAGLWARDDFGSYREGDTFATTIIFRKNNRKWEPHAGLTEDRWSNLQVAREDYGIRTWVSVEPVIYPDQALEVIRRAGREGVGAVKIGKLNYHPYAKTVDWPRFGDDLAEALGQSDLPYLVKDSLHPYMPEGFPLDTLAAGND